MVEHATVTAPEMIGVLIWWALMLCAPVIIVRRWRRRGRPRHMVRLRRWPRATGARQEEFEALRVLPATPAGTGAVSEEVADPSAAEAAGESRGNHPGAADARPVANRWALGLRSASRAPGRLCAETLEPLCRYVDFRRRLALAVSELETRLSQLPADRWRIEPYPLTGERRNTLLVLGETGVFVLSATYAPGHWDDVIAVSRLATKIQLLLPEYAGEVQPAVCYPFSALRPRIWHRPDEHGDWVGAWVTGGDSIREWLEHFGPQHGLNSVDLERFDRLAKPDWLKAAIPTPPSWPAIPEATRPDTTD